MHHKISYFISQNSLAPCIYKGNLWNPSFSFNFKICKRAYFFDITGYFTSYFWGNISNGLDFQMCRMDV